MRIIDLSLEIEPTPGDFMEHPERTLPHHMLTQFVEVLMRNEIYPVRKTNWESPNLLDRARSHKLEVFCHAYTHCETSANRMKEGKFIHDYPIDRWVAKACVMNFSHKEQGSRITPEELEKQWVEGCDGLIIRTDWPKKRGLKAGVMGATEEDEETSPKFTREAMDWIIAKKPKLYTEDFGCCPKLPGMSAGKKVMFEAGICHVMNITNLDQIKKKVVTLIALPLKIRKTSVGIGVEATPTRAIAIEDD